MALPSFTVLSPLDGRYKEQVSEVATMFSELNLILVRLSVEIKWFETLVNNVEISSSKTISKQSSVFLQDIIKNFNKNDLLRISELERQTNHDVKAIEYFLKEKFESHKELKQHQELIHFACTSDDINNLSYAIIMLKTREDVLIPLMESLIFQIKGMAINYADVPMISRTHGQPATPTTLGKELANFIYRLTRQFNYFLKSPILGKFNGTIGCFNSHIITNPKINWQEICETFVKHLKLDWNPYTTQIEPHDWIAEYCDILAHFNTIMIGFCRDIWFYISIDYFKQKAVSNEVGSSVMPHKINPIDFENAEGNLGVANALLQHFSNKLPISRLQRDLSDSTVMRNIGMAIGYCILSYKVIQRGLNKLTPNEETIQKDLDNNWQILSEAIQTVMRQHKIPNSYEQLKSLTRGKKITKKIIHAFINKLDIPKTAKQKLLKLTPQSYIGKAAELAKKI